MCTPPVAGPCLVATLPHPPGRPTASTHKNVLLRCNLAEPCLRIRRRDNASAGKSRKLTGSGSEKPGDCGWTGLQFGPLTSLESPPGLRSGCCANCAFRPFKPTHHLHNLLFPPPAAVQSRDSVVAWTLPAHIPRISHSRSACPTRRLLGPFAEKGRNPILRISAVLPSFALALSDLSG